MSKEWRTTDPNAETPIFTSTLNAHFDTLFQVLDERFFAIDSHQDRMEKDIHILKTDVTTLRDDV
ncbi:MAG: hypothetical protein J2P36_32980, partial [Ktedonobacteraceae bacterium]|nr:hypothetical protein [Ktedonobacteraceae bacterium]